MDKIFECHEWGITDISKAIYVIPRYQRLFSWRAKQINDFLKTLFDGFEKNEFEFLGAVYFKEIGNYKGLIIKYEIVDGQQRISVYILIGMAILYYLVINNASKEDVDKVKALLWKKEGDIFNKELKILTMKSYDEIAFNRLFSKAYSSPKELMSLAVDMAKNGNSVEKHIGNSFINITKKIIRFFDDKNPLDFLEYLKNAQISANFFDCDYQKMFSIFLSLNGKGLKLPSLDMICSYIFSKIDVNYSEEYLEKWAELRETTKDKLNDFFNCYIKAFIQYFTNDISLYDFYTLTESLKEKFSCNNLSDTFRAMIDDMVDKADLYVKTPENTFKRIQNSEFRFYHEWLCMSLYTQVKPIYLRIISDYRDEKCPKEEATKSFAEVIKFMFEFMSISRSDSRACTPYVKQIMENAYRDGVIRFDLVNEILTEAKSRHAITKDSIRATLKTMDVYKTNKLVCKVVLSEYCSIHKDKNGESYLSYDEAYERLRFKYKTDTFDHLLVERPNVKDNEFKYYVEKNQKTDIEVVRLLEGHDFDEDIYDRMPYDKFLNRALNRIGNIRILYHDQNSRRQNDVYVDPKYGKFVTFKQVNERFEDIIDAVIDYI